MDAALKSWRELCVYIQTRHPDVSTTSRLRPFVRELDTLLRRLERRHVTRWLLMTPVLAVALRHRWGPYGRVTRNGVTGTVMVTGGLLLLYVSVVLWRRR